MAYRRGNIAAPTINFVFCKVYKNTMKNSVKITKKVLDKCRKWWYHNWACVGKLCAYCDDAGDCV